MRILDLIVQNCSTEQLLKHEYCNMIRQEIHEGHITEDVISIYRCDFPVFEINSLARTQTLNLCQPRLI